MSMRMETPIVTTHADTDNNDSREGVLGSGGLSVEPL